ncbi:MAG: S41 family peptidase [Lachnospiraceae bacterium]
MNKKDFWSGLFSGLLIAIFILCCIICGRIIADAVREDDRNVNSSADSRDYDSVLDNPDVINKVEILEETISKYYINDVDQEDLANGIYDGIMSALDDPYAAYYTPEEWVELYNSTEGVFYGIGAVLMRNETLLYPQITRIITDSPAEKSGLEIDDIIYKVDGVDVYDMQLEEVVRMIKGEEGTTVHLEIVRQSTGETFELDLVRQKIESPTVSISMLENDIAHITITEFDSVTVDQFAEALAEARAYDMKGLILDLRGNPGGSLTAVVEIAQMLLPEGLVVYTEDKYGNREEYICDGKHEIDVPMVVLVNGGSASAAEILAGAIKDYEVGTLLGTTTFGKGIVQRLVALEDGSAVKFTVSHYYTPLGNDIHHVGIEPDEVLELDIDAYREDGTDNQLNRAIEILEQKIN